MSLLGKAFQSSDRDGANQILVQGRMGSGKTTLLRAFAYQAIQKGHAVIWRARPNRDQWHLLPGNTKILVPQGSDIDFSREVAQELHPYSGPSDIIRKLHRGLNVVIEPGLTKPWDAIFWLAVWHFLNERRTFPWATMIYDELKDTFPSQSYGPYYFIMPQVSSVFRDMRRSRTEFMATIHEPKDIHWEWVGKFRTIIYMHGSQRITGKRVRQGIISHLEPGRVIVEMDDQFADVALAIPDSQYPSSLMSYWMSHPKPYVLEPRTMEYVRQVLPQDIISQISGQESKKKGKIKAPEVELEEFP